MEDNKPYKVYCDDCKKLIYTGICPVPPPGILDSHICSEKSRRLKLEFVTGFEFTEPEGYPFSTAEPIDEGSAHPLIIIVAVCAMFCGACFTFAIMRLL